MHEAFFIANFLPYSFADENFARIFPSISLWWFEFLLVQQNQEIKVIKKFIFIITLYKQKEIKRKENMLK